MSAPVVRERYVDARELAATMGVSTTTVKRWVAAGLPSETWGLRTRRFLVSEAIQWARDHADTVRRDQPRPVALARRRAHPLKE